MSRSYSELARIHTLDDRFDYLALGGRIGETTFGFERWLNQRFYRSAEWRRARDHVIARDNGLDLGARDVPIRGPIAVHHMNPLTPEDIEEGSENLLDPEFLISAAMRTHNAVHFGDKSLLPQPFVERQPGDTNLW